MAAVSSLVLGVAAAGAAVSGYSAYRQSEARQDATEASQRAERLREKQMQLESMRKQRELIRQSQAARSLALARSTAQGGGTDDTALFGAYGQTQGAYGRASNADIQNRDIGAGIFDANRDLAGAQGDIATWEGIGSFGKSVTGASMQIAQIGSTLFQPSIGPWETTTTRG